MFLSLDVFISSPFNRKCQWDSLYIVDVYVYYLVQKKKNTETVGCRITSDDDDTDIETPSFWNKS